MESVKGKNLPHKIFLGLINMGESRNVIQRRQPCIKYVGVISMFMELDTLLPYIIFYYLIVNTL